MKINTFIYSTITFVSLNLISLSTLSANCGSCGSCGTSCSTNTCSTCNSPCYEPCNYCPEPCPAPCPEPCCPAICDCDAKLMAFRAGFIIGIYEASTNTNLPNKLACSCWDAEQLRKNSDEAMAELEYVLSRTDCCMHADIMFQKSRGIAEANRIYIYGSPEAVCQNYVESLERLAYYKCLFSCEKPCAPEPCPQPCYTPCEAPCTTCPTPCATCPAPQPACPSCAPAPCVTKPANCSSCLLQSY